MTVSAAVLDGWGEIATRLGELKSDRVASVLEQQILLGVLPAGTVLPPEVELVGILGVSRTVVRDAVRTLVAKNLLVAKQGRGTMVAEPSNEAFARAMVAMLARSGLTMGDVMQSRMIIEMFVVEIAAGARTDEDLNALTSSYESLAEAISSGDAEAASEAHAMFHRGILQATHQPALEMMLRPISEIATLTGGASVREGSMRDWELEAHLPILRALEDRDPEAATEAMRAHFEVSMRPSLYGEFLDRPFAQAHFGEQPG